MGPPRKGTNHAVEKPKTCRDETPGACPEPAPELPGISRRQLIRFFALSCAGLLAPNALAVREAGGPVRKGQFLNEGQMKLLRELAETIIPETDTPGAAATDTHGFIDDQLANCHAPDEARRFAADLDRFGLLARQYRGEGFEDLSSADRHAALTAFAYHEPPFDALPADFFRRLKALTVIGYYSSEAGASQELVYLPLAGGYQGDFKLAENGGRAFSPRVF